MPVIPINIKTGTFKEKEYIIGIDLGTTNSLVAIIDNGIPLALTGKNKEAIVPSLVHFADDHAVVVGAEAHPYLVSAPGQTIYSVKRLMGKSYKDVREQQQYFSYQVIDDDTDSLVKVRVGNRFFTPIELSSYILKDLKARAEDYLRAPVKKAVITVPAYFNDAQRQATRDAGKLAGLEVLRIVNEPTAASLAYGLGMGAGEAKTVAVYDLGGGTFDISILHIHNGIFEVLATNGDTYLGGDDFDRAVAEFWIKKYGFDHGQIFQDKSAVQQLRLLAEAAKKQLSAAPVAELAFDWQGKKTMLNLSHEELETVIAPVVSRTLACCRAALADSGITLQEIDEVILVGGSTRMPLVKNKVAAYFQHSVLHDQLNPDEVVALGAAVEADILAGNRKDMLLLDVTPLSLGIETLGGLMDTMIARNTRIPASVAKEYTTSVDGQVRLKINVFQGERELVKENRMLAEFELTGIPAMPAGMPKIRVTFMLNADGILKVEATETRSEVSQQVEIKPQYGLTDEQVEKMLMDSITHAEADVSTRMVIEARTEGEQLIYVIERFLTKNVQLLSEEEVQQTAFKLSELKKSLESNDKDHILGLIEDVNEYTRPFAERLMDIAVSQALKGKTIE